MKKRAYSRYGSGEEDSFHSNSGVVSLHWKDGRVCQISGAEEEDSRGKHLLIRVWGENGTAENGGSNITEFSVSLRPLRTGWVIEYLDARQPWQDKYPNES